ncbi:MAG: FecR domain-containing protein [Polyangiales bacterium]
MAEREPREAALLDRVELEGWSVGHVEAELGRLHRRRARRARGRRQLAAAGALACVAAAAALLMWRGAAEDAAPAVADGRSDGPPGAVDGAFPDAPGTHHFADGSRAIPVGAASELTPVLTTDAEVRVRLERGAGSFDVTPNRERRFVVEVGSLQVIVLGTSFGVDRRGDEAHVHVTRGLVRVRWPSGEALLPAGAEGTFPCVPEHATESAEPATLGTEGASTATAAPDGRGVGAEPQLATNAPSEPARPGEARLSARPAPEALHGASPGGPPSARSWRELAQAGDTQAAYRALAAGAPVADTVGDQLLAADVARRSGHPASAMPYLRRVWEAHPTDPQAALASFTAGRLLLRSGQPAAAAEAFARARRLAPGGSLSEDALAREAEAWARAGQGERAAQLAREYERRYPSGRRAAEVRALGAGP